MLITWDMLRDSVSDCTGCELSRGRTRTVFGEGDEEARILFVGEGPGREEDLEGRPFVGPAGQLLTKMLAAIGFGRSDVYIANIVKCRPPQNRVPTEAEALACLPYLRAQTALMKPWIIVCLGATAARYVYGSDTRIMRDRGVWKEKKGIWILPTYHPAALLRDPDKKKDAWKDMQAVRSRYEALVQEHGCTSSQTNGIMHNS